MNLTQTEQAYVHAKQIIPGGVQLLSKRPEMFIPGQWPAYAARAKGCEIWDMDGNHYYDMHSNGIGACLLGYADPDVSRAVIQRVENGSMSTLNAHEEVLLADKLLEIHPWAENVRFSRTGGETCAIAVRIARATTGRDVVAICGYHGWADWYIACNLGDTDALGRPGQLMPGLDAAGVPSSLRGSAVTFVHGDYEEFDNIIREYGDRLACVIMEPFRNVLPSMDFMNHVRDEVHRVGGLFILDEITIGWRYCFGGSHLALGITPDIAVFAKALGNGHPIGAILGTTAALDGAHNSFISSTYWTEAVGPTAALATIEKMEKTRVWEHAAHIGTILQKDWAEAAANNGVKINTFGVPCHAQFSWNEDCPKELKTLFTKLMLEEGFLATPLCYPTLAHNEDILDKHRVALNKTFRTLGDLLKKGGKEAVSEAIGGPVCHGDFQRLLK